MCFDYYEDTEVSQDIDQLKAKVLELQGLAELFKALADETRSKLVYALSLQELVVGDLAEILDTTPSNVSHHLRYLRAARLVKYRKVGRRVFYSLDDDHVDGIIKLGIEHLAHI